MRPIFIPKAQGHKFETKLTKNFTFSKIVKLQVNLGKSGIFVPILENLWTYDWISQVVLLRSTWENWPAKMNQFPITNKLSKWADQNNQSKWVLRKLIGLQRVKIDCCYEGIPYLTDKIVSRPQD